MNKAAMRRAKFKRMVPGAGAVVRILVWVAAVAAAALILLKVVFQVDLAFVRTTRVLKTTVLTLEDIRSMEFLITAEYFGEVIGTARDYFVRRSIPGAEKLIVRLEGEAAPDLFSLPPAEQFLINAVRATLVKRSLMYLGVLDRVVDLEGTLELIGLEMQGGRFRPDFAEALVEVLLEKRDIAYLARGKVQAGYNLAGLDENKYFFCRASGAVFLLAEPEILARDINPWFIYDPDHGHTVKGFEIISQSGIDLEEEDALDFIKSVKEECRLRLQEDALRTGLREQARSSAEETVGNLFRIFNPRVRSVKFLGREEFEKARDACSRR